MRGRRCSKHQSRDFQAPVIQPNTHPAQLEEISSCCFLLGRREESLPGYNLLSERDKISPKPLLLQAKIPLFPQFLLVRLVLQTLILHRNMILKTR